MQVLRACIAIVSTPTKLVVYSTSWVKNDRKDEQCSKTADVGIKVVRASAGSIHCFPLGSCIQSIHLRCGSFGSIIRFRFKNPDLDLAKNVQVRDFSDHTEMCVVQSKRPEEMQRISPMWLWLEYPNGYPFHYLFHRRGVAKAFPFEMKPIWKHQARSIFMWVNKQTNGRRLIEGGGGGRRSHHEFTKNSFAFHESRNENLRFQASQK